MLNVYVWNRFSSKRFSYKAIFTPNSQDVRKFNQISNINIAKYDSCLGRNRRRHTTHFQIHIYNIYN